MATNNLEGLSDLQRRNLAAMRIKRAQIRNQFGNNIQIADTDEQVLQATGPMAIPASALMTDKQIVIRMANVLEHLDGSKELVSDKTDQRLAANLEDVLDALESTADIMEDQLKGPGRTAKKAAAEFVVPAGYRLVKIEDENQKPAPEPVAELPIVRGNDLGVAVPKESKLSDKEALDELLA